MYRKGLTRNVGLELIVAKGKFVEVNTLIPEVDRILQGVFPIAENDDAILLRVDPESLRRSRTGTISGQVYLQTDAGSFPELGWDDIVVPVLCAWLNAVNFVSAGSKAQTVHFMEGPFRVELKHALSGMISLLLVEDGNRQEFFACTNTLRRNACEAADSILTKCRQLAWFDPDIDQLARLRDQTSL
jgi:hypothetical protein